MTTFRFLLIVTALGVSSALAQDESAIRGSVAALDRRFAEANTYAEYSTLRSDAQRLRDRAAALGLRDAAFMCAVISADSANFGTRAPDAPAAEKAQPVAALEDVLQAFQFRRSVTDRAWLDRFTVRTAAAVGAATERLLLDARGEDALKRLAPLVEQGIATDFSYGTPVVGDLRLSIEIARELADLSYRYGDVEIASARLVAAERRAADLGDIGLVVALLSARHAGERFRRAEPARLAGVRDEAWKYLPALRNEYRSSTGRIWAADRSDTSFGRMLKGELEDPAAVPASVFARAESLRARTLLDRLSMPGTTELRTAQALELEGRVLSFAERKAPDNSLTAIEMRLLSRLSGFDISGDSTADGSRARALGTLEDLYRGAGAGYSATAPPATLDTLRAALAPDEALIEYLVPDPVSPALDLWILLVTRDGVRITHSGDAAPRTSAGRFFFDGAAPLDLSALATLIATTRTDIRSSNDRAARRGLAALYQLLVAPLEARGFRPESYKRIVVVPHGALHYVPFAALIDAGGQFLIAKTEIVLAPSASVWQLLSARQRKAGPLVALANPNLGSRGGDGLPFADQEGRAIVKLLPAGARLFAGPDATRTNLLADAPAAGILHLATHGEFPDDNAANAHSLWFANGGGNGVALTASDVRGLSLPQARLVVLSVCNGGLYRIGPADEPYGLLPAFLEAGATNVLGTVWPLDDEFGRDFMIEFYRHLSTMGPAAALRQASLRFTGEKLRLWAAFVLVGSGRFD